jgi:hypothetical protein
MQRVLSIVATIVVLAAIGVGGFFAIDRFVEEEETPEPEEEIELVTAVVTRADLIDEETLEGTIRFASPGRIVAQAAGTITATPDVGTILERGRVAYEVDGAPVVVMYGDRPAWRALDPDADDGVDVLQLETNLVELGFDEESFEVDEAYTNLTSDLVEEWEESLGLEPTGEVPLGRVLFLSEPVRIADVLVEPGDVIAPGATVMTTSGTTREIQLWLDADRPELLAVGDSVGIVLPDDVETSGTVVDISRTVTTLGSGPDARRVRDVTIAPSDATLIAAFDESPVDVEVVSSAAVGVLTVPVNALLALAEGGYALEIPRADGGIDRIPVEIGEFADGLVEVIGDISEGTVVLVPQ